MESKRIRKRECRNGQNGTKSADPAPFGRVENTRHLTINIFLFLVVHPFFFLLVALHLFFLLLLPHPRRSLLLLLLLLLLFRVLVRLHRHRGPPSTLPD